ncbi:olfactory receptor 8G1-like [Ambystoma mexicanum]|uniref:olfactory receptor 8G1-like n=1 Tax=Ambystoma mexicanum TaxID=8296 RepID=UPI0037E99682
MKRGNRTLVTEFILLGLTEDPRLQLPLFVVFFSVYIITVVGNLGIITLIMISPNLQTSMYFLISNMSFVDMCYSSIITPNMLANFLSKKKIISFPGCVAQLFFFIIIGSTEVFLLTVMAYDRFVAICNPLIYVSIMTTRVCIYFVVGAYIISFINALIHTMCTFRLSFCDLNTITHFYCDVPPLLKLSCSDTSLNVAMMVYVGGGLILGSLVCIIVSYVYIIFTIFKIRASEGRRRAFSTCSSHFVCVVLLFGALLFMYLRPNSKYSMEQDRVASVFYTIFIPMFNPIIYSLRNKDVKVALQKLMSRKNVGR